MSHELRTPLHTVIGFSELLAEDQRATEPGSETLRRSYLQRLTAPACTDQRGSRSQQGEAGKLELRRECLEIGEVLEDALSSIRPQGHEKLIEIEIDATDRIWVNGDRIRVRQILFNLLSNAVKFTPEGGRVWTDCSVVDGFAQVSVSDNGLGIPLEECDSVFETFHQVGGAAIGTREGTGLGLPITKRLVEEHGGRIWLETEVGHGSRFTFTIPLEQRHEKSVGIAG